MVLFSSLDGLRTLFLTVLKLQVRKLCGSVTQASYNVSIYTCACRQHVTSASSQTTYFGCLQNRLTARRLTAKMAPQTNVTSRVSVKLTFN